MQKYVLTWPALLTLVLSACGPSANVPSASCSSCGTTADTCSMLAAANGCKTSSFTPGSGSQCAGCKFTDCDEPPSCVTASYGRDAGPKDAGDIDPACKTADADGDGLFSSTPPCANPHTLTVNGATSYTCPCTGACPCGYECGSIKLSSGGVVSSVCAPPAP